MADIGISCWVNEATSHTCDRSFKRRGGRGRPLLTDNRETTSESLGRVQKETITMAILTIILLVSTAFALGDARIRPMTPCERARYAATHGPIGAYIPTCDAAGRYTPKQCSGSTGYCWCVTTTGQKIQGTETPPGTAINC
ncbi:nidogen-2-like [Salmo trutta]|uniref:Nidogen-2-like n=2 Tax=Salmo trutta TaxID=8032 RepID=A0A674AJ53_SALTR|nr:nidogen-2-like [Salmo trutta]